MTIQVWPLRPDRKRGRFLKSQLQRCTAQQGTASVSFFLDFHFTSITRFDNDYVYCLLYSLCWHCFYVRWKVHWSILICLFVNTSSLFLSFRHLPSAAVVNCEFTQGFMSNSKFEGTDFSNGIVDRVSFEGSSLKGSLFINTVLTSTSFKDADLTDADFSNA